MPHDNGGEPRTVAVIGSEPHAPVAPVAPVEDGLQSSVGVAAASAATNAGAIAAETAA